MALLCAFGLVFAALADSTNCIAPPSGIIGWWPGDSNTVDIVGGHHGVFVNGSIYGTGKVGPAFTFDGIANEVTNPVPALTNILDSYTVEFWAYPVAARASTPEDITGVSGDQNQRYAIFPNNGKFGAAGAGVSVGTNGVSVFEHASAYLASPLVYDAVLNGWTHIGVAYSNRQPRLYLNGVLVRTGLTSTHPSSPSTCFGENSLGYGYYAGLLDEVSIYNRTLTAAEIASIYNAGSAGKCQPPIAPIILVQPTNQTVYVGDTAIFFVGAYGSKPLSYQWNFSGSPLPNATDATLTLPNVQHNQAGNYSVLITNAYGSTNSAGATLTVLDRPPTCADRPAGIIAWWQGEGNGRDSVGTNDGKVLNGLTFTNGEVNRAFWFDGSDDILVVSNSPGLNFTNGADFSIEGWIQAFAHSTAFDVISIIDKRYNQGVGYEMSLEGGNLHCRLADNSGGGLVVTCGGPDIRDGVFHHIALTVARNSATGCNFYVDAQLVGTFDTSGIPGDLSNPAPLYLGQNSGFPGIGTTFQGAMDEMSLYGRALTASEISNIVYYGHSGKCLIPPYIVAQPTNETVKVGDIAEFFVRAGGSEPLSYQWSFKSNTIPSATNNPLDLPNVQSNQAGLYSAFVSNPVGSTNSTNALLTIIPGQPCTAPPTNLVSWWRAESNAVDSVSGNDGAIWSGADFGPGRVGTAFSMNGRGGVIFIGGQSTPNLQLQDFTIEGWIRRASTTATSLNGNGNGHIFGFNTGGYGVYLDPSGHPALTKVGINNVTSSATITDTNFHHLAVTKTNSTVVFFIDGVAYPAAAYNPGFTFNVNGSPFIGGIITNFSFYGMIDELAVYNRALAANEVQGIYNAGSSGKCIAPIPPFFVMQPTNQTGLIGTAVTIATVASGSMPLSYQWSFNGTPVPGATGSALTFNNAQPSQAGNYSVSVTNIAGSITSTNALLTLVYPTAVVRAVSTNVASGSIVTVPITIAANGNENALAFSLNFDTTKLTYAGVSLGSGASGGFLIPNTSATNAGRFGLSVALPYGSTFSPGTQEVARVSFASAVIFTPSQTITPISFGDQPTSRQLLDSQVNTIPAGYSNGTVTISAATGYEGDVFPRSNGDTNVALADWLIMGRYVARLESPTNAAQFQRADCAPRATLGDGVIRVTDWVQADRYVSGLDPLTPVGGPTNQLPPGPHTGSSNRVVMVGGFDLVPGEMVTTSIYLAGQGNENALGFTLQFDPGLLRLVDVKLGNDAGGATMLVNTNQAAAGLLGVVLAAGTGNSFPVNIGHASDELAQITFVGLNGPGTAALSFSDALVPSEISDAGANALPASYGTSFVSINANPLLKIGQAGTNIVLAWPLWANDFTLQEAPQSVAEPIIWTNLPNVPFNSNGESTVVLPLNRTNKFYRLWHP